MYIFGIIIFYRIFDTDYENIQKMHFIVQKIQMVNIKTQKCTYCNEKSIFCVKSCANQYMY